MRQIFLFSLGLRILLVRNGDSRSPYGFWISLMFTRPLRGRNCAIDLCCFLFAWTNFIYTSHPPRWRKRRRHIETGHLGNAQSGHIYLPPRLPPREPPRPPRGPPRPPREPRPPRPPRPPRATVKPREKEKQQIVSVQANTSEQQVKGETGRRE